MSLKELRDEVLARGFDAGMYSDRIDKFLNDGMALIARRVDYYANETSYPFATTAGVTTYGPPPGFARARSVYDADRNVEMRYVGIRDIDRAPVASGSPSAYAIVAQQSVQLYPVPDGAYNLVLRYWQMPALMVNDNDQPGLPADWAWLLWVYATWRVFEAEDDPSMGQYWQGQFNSGIAMFSADVKFPDTDGPSQARSMWDTNLITRWH